MNYNEFYLHFYYSSNFTSVPFKCTVEKKKKKCKSSLFSKTTRNISITFVMNFFIAALENIYIETKHSSNEFIFWEEQGKWKGNSAW